jgi:hypothetical protein
MFDKNNSKRDCPRLKVTAQARVSKPGSEGISGILGQVIDVSMEGISMKMNDELQFDTRYSMKLSVYPDIEFDFNCQVVWSAIESGGRLYGFEFVD